MNHAILISAYTADNSDKDNASETQVLEAAIMGIISAVPGASYARAVGVYQGETEKSFMVVFPNYEAPVMRKVFTSLSEDFNQECILYVGDKGAASLENFNGSKTIGRFLPSTATNGDCTIVNGNTYVVK